MSNKDLEWAKENIRKKLGLFLHTDKIEIMGRLRLREGLVNQGTAFRYSLNLLQFTGCPGYFEVITTCNEFIFYGSRVSLYLLIHSDDPQSRSVVIIVFAYVVRSSITVGLAEWIIDGIHVL